MPLFEDEEEAKLLEDAARKAELNGNFDTSLKLYRQAEKAYDNISGCSSDAARCRTIAELMDD